MTSPEGTSLADHPIRRVLTRLHLRRFTPWVSAFSLMFLLTGPGVSGLAHAEETAGLVREYFVRQEAEQPLVIRVNPFEAEFGVEVSGPNGEVLKRAELPGNRVQPLFLFVDGSQRERQLDIRVEAPVFTSETRFDLEFYRLDVRDALSERLARAYRLLAGGAEYLATDTAANWSVKINMLIQSARLFEEFGMEELRLWAVLAAAHLAHFELGDSAASADWAAQVIQAARLSALAGPSFAGQVLLSEVLFQQADRSDAGVAAKQAAGTALENTSRLAGLVGNRYEQAWSLFLLGEGLARQGQHEAALERYQQALDVAVPRGATGLSTDIRKQMVATHEVLGDVVATEQALDNMVEQLAIGGAESELVKGLLAQGGLYLELYRYPDAEYALREALAIDSVSLTRTHAAILLGIALYEMGRFEEAVETLAGALVNPQSGLFRRPNPLLPLTEGLDALAGAYRNQGLHTEARRVRTVMSRHLETNREFARWERQRVLDELAANNPGAADTAYRQAQTRFRAEHGSIQGALALLALCAEAAPTPSICERTAVESAAEKAAAGTPRDMFDARFRLAQIQAREGRRAEAGAALVSLLIDVHFFRTELSGVLGAWFWENRETLFGVALDVTAGAGPASALNSLSTLARILAIGRVVEFYGGNDALRSTFGAPRSNWQVAVRQHQNRFSNEAARLLPSSIETWLGGFSNEEAVLAWLPGRDGVHRWLADNSGVQYRRLPIDEALAADLASLAIAETVGAQRRVGKALLAGLDDLPNSLYWLPVGHMLGTDPGRLIIDGQRLGNGRQILALLDFPASRPVVSGSIQSSWERVFLAGDPVDWSSAVPERLSLSPEMEAVREQVAGPGLHLLQGNALLADEFSNNRLQQATWVHLALPARINLARAEQSALELSEPGRAAGRETLTPDQIRRWSLSAKLWVLGQTSVVGGEVPNRYDSRLGIVSDLLEAGAEQVLTCRPNESAAQVLFMQTFYRALGQGEGVADALQQARRDDGLAPDCQRYSR